MSAYGNKKKRKKISSVLSENNVTVNGSVQGFVFGGGPQLPSPHSKPCGRAVASIQNSLPTFPLEIPRPKKKKAKPGAAPKKKVTPTVQHVTSHAGKARYEVIKVKSGSQEFSSLIIRGGKNYGNNVLLRKMPDDKRKEK